MSNISVISEPALIDGGIGNRFVDAADETEDALRRLVGSYPGPVVVVLPRTGEILHESVTARSLLRTDSGPHSRREFSYHFANPEDCSDLLQRLRTEFEVSDAELELSRLDGSTFWASISASFISTDFFNRYYSRIFRESICHHLSRYWH